jgi:hypothetical protein
VSTHGAAPASARGPVPGEIIAEFADSGDALAFARSKGRGYTVTAGINLPFAVRPLVWLGLPAP